MNAKDNARKALGLEGEGAASRYLESIGYTIEARNYRVISGEIDIVARKGDLLAFVEVKSRSGSGFLGEPRNAVTMSKQKKLALAAMTYLSEFGRGDELVRFDVIEYRSGRITHLPDAFRPEGDI